MAIMLCVLLALVAITLVAIGLYALWLGLHRRGHYAR